MPYFSLYPTSIHAWAQSDLLAISKGFLRNGFDLFHPETFIYNKEFPNMWRTASETTITSGNLAIHQYMVAIFMKITGTTEPIIYRLYVFFLSIIGIFFIFKIADQLKLKPIYALLGVSFFVFSPIYLYYQANFLITIPVLTTTICGIYHYLKFLENQSLKNWIFTISLLTLSALTRTTFIIPLIAVCCHQLLIYFKNRQFNFKPFLISLIGFTLIFGFFYYNRLIRNEHGSIFLSSIKPAKNLQHFLDCLFEINLIWKGHYFSGLTKIVLILIFSALILLPRIGKKYNFKNPLFFIIIFLAGTILFFISMIQQFVYHDYYFIDSLFLPVILLSFLGLRKIQASNLLIGFRATIFSILCLIFVGFSAFNGHKKLNERYIQWANDDVTKTIHAFADSRSFLAANHVPKNARIMVFGCYGPNAPFLMMDRKGYCVDFTNQKEVEKILEWDFDYIVISNFYLKNRVIPEMPFLTEHLISIATNFEITLFKPGKSNHKNSLIDLLKPEANDFKYYSLSDVKSQDKKWNFLERNSEADLFFTVPSGIQSGFRWLSKGLKINNKAKPKKIFFEAKIQLVDSTEFSPIDIFVLQNNKAVFYKSHTFKELNKKNRGWQKIQILEDLPQNLSGKFEFGLQQNNIYHSNFRIDSLIIGVY